MNKRFETEILREIWDNNCASSHYQVGHDDYALGLVELRYIKTEGDPEKIYKIVLLPEMARLVARAMLLCADEVEAANLQENP